MKNCPKCNKVVKDEAKFCGGCGHKFGDDSILTAGMTCPKCAEPVKPGAKFCGKCGTKLEQGADTSTLQSNGKNLEQVGNGGFVRWSMIPGQVAVKITEDEIEACGKIKGIVVQEGTKALFFVDGKITAELAPGNYKFEDLKSGAASSGSFAGWCARWVSRVAQYLTGRKSAISVVLVRETEIPLIFTIDGANTSGIRSTVALHVLCKVTNINEFYRNLLLDRRFVSSVELQSALMTEVANQVNLVVADVTPDLVANNPGLAQSLHAQLQASVSGVYPYLALTRIVRLTAEHKAIEELRRMAEELYISEQELVQLQKRNDFLNRLQSVKNDQSLTEGQMGADFESSKLEIYKQMELTKDEQDKFDLMLAAEKKLREASTQEQIDAALHEYAKSGMVRGEEIDRLRHQGRMADIRDAQESEMAEMQGELARRRVKDDYDDERRMKDAAFEDERRRAELDLDKQEQQNQLEMLRQAQAIRKEREDAEHRRQMEAEKLKLDAKLENQRIYAGMSVEQIMASNPDISADAAKALAQKFAFDGKDELLRAREADMARQNAQQMEMMRMMQQMAMAGMGVKQDHQSELMAAKQAELNRVREDANRHEDRVLAGVQTTVSAAGVAFGGHAGMAQQQQQSKVFASPGAPSMSSSGEGQPSSGKCPSCGSVLEPDSSFCGECGSAV